MLLSSRMISDNLKLLMARSPDLSQPELASRMGIGSKTLWNIKEGEGNTTLDKVDKIARYYRIEPWQLLIPNGPSLDRTALSTATSSTISPQAQQLIDRLRAMESSGTSSPALIDAIERILDLVEPEVGENDYKGLMDEFSSEE